MSGRSLAILPGSWVCLFLPGQFGWLTTMQSQRQLVVIVQSAERRRLTFVQSGLASGAGPEGDADRFRGGYAQRTVREESRGAHT